MNPRAEKSKGIFIGWSGPRSSSVAQALKHWLRCLSLDIEPWVSTLDLRPGGRWWGELEAQLQVSEAGILCITPDNKNSPWLHFEAGALARSVNSRLIIPYAIDLDTAAILDPIGFFQGVAANRQGTFRMISELFASMKVEYDWDSNIFEVFWPLLERALDFGQGADTMQSALGEIERVAIARRSTELKEVVLPQSARHGETISLEYLIETKAQDVEIWLGASICIAKGDWANRTDQDEVVTLERGVRRSHRTLTVSETIPPGEYDFNAELWFGPKSDPRHSYPIQRKWPAGKIRIL
jgi:hypothetical protein